MVPALSRIFWCGSAVCVCESVPMRAFAREPSWLNGVELCILFVSQGCCVTLHQWG